MGQCMDSFSPSYPKKKKKSANEQSVPASEHYTAVFSVDLRHERSWNKRDSREGVAGVCRKTIERALLFFLFVCYRHKLSLYPARLFYVHNAGFHLHNACEMRAY